MVEKNQKDKSKEKSNELSPKNQRTHTPHNDFFLRTMSKMHIAKDFIDHRLPSHIKSHLDLSTLKLENGNFIESDDFIDKKLKKLYTDILYSVQTNHQKKAYLFILCEHQSTSERLMPLRIFKYMLSIAERHLKDSDSPEGHFPLIWPLIIYNGQKPYAHSTRFLDLYEPEFQPDAARVLTEPLQLLDLNILEDEESRDHVWSKVIALALKANLKRSIKNFNQVAENLAPWLAKIESHPDGPETIKDISWYTLEIKDVKAPEVEPRAYLETLTQHLSQPTRKTVMSIADQLRQEGLEQGFGQGIEKERITIILNMLKKNMDLQTISDVTELSIEEILKLQNKAKNEKAYD